MGCEPVHVAMRAGVEEVAEMPAGVDEDVRSGNADAVKSQRTGFARERGSQRFSGGI